MSNGSSAMTAVSMVVYWWVIWRRGGLTLQCDSCLHQRQLNFKGGVKEVRWVGGVLYFWKLRVQIAGNLNSSIPFTPAHRGKLFIKAHEVRAKWGALSSFPHVVLGRRETGDQYEVTWHIRPHLPRAPCTLTHMPHKGPVLPRNKCPDILGRKTFMDSNSK